jgi:hypothetical protein
MKEVLKTMVEILKKLIEETLNKDEWVIGNEYSDDYRATLKNKPEIIISKENNGAKIVAEVEAVFDFDDMTTAVYVYCELHTLDGHCLATELLDSIENYDGFIDGDQIKRLASETLNNWLSKIGSLKFNV